MPTALAADPSLAPTCTQLERSRWIRFRGRSFTLEPGSAIRCDMMKWKIIVVGVLVGMAGVAPAWAGCTDRAEPGVDWRNCFFARKDLSGVDLTGAKLRDASLKRTDLTGANLSNTDAFGAKFVSAKLSNAKFDGARLAQADLTRLRLHRLCQDWRTHGTVDRCGQPGPDPPAVPAVKVRSAD